MTEEAADQLLIQRIADRDEAALAALYDRYERSMYAFAFRIVNDAMASEEIVQELFMRIWHAAERYAFDKGKVSTWMFAVTRNIAIDVLRRKSRRPLETAEEKAAVVRSEETAVEDKIEQQWVGAQIASALQSLNADQRQVVEYIYYKGFTQQEVALKYEIPLGTVKSRVRLAMSHLKDKLTGLGKGERGND